MVFLCPSFGAFSPERGNSAFSASTGDTPSATAIFAANSLPFDIIPLFFAATSGAISLPAIRFSASAYIGGAADPLASIHAPSLNSYCVPCSEAESFSTAEFGAASPSISSPSLCQRPFFRT